MLNKNYGFTLCKFAVPFSFLFDERQLTTKEKLLNILRNRKGNFPFLI